MAHSVSVPGRTVSVTSALQVASLAAACLLCMPCTLSGTGACCGGKGFDVGSGSGCDTQNGFGSGGGSGYNDSDGKYRRGSRSGA